MVISIERRTGARQAGPGQPYYGSRGAPPDAVSVGGDEPVTIQFSLDGVPVRFPVGTVITLGFKAWGKFDEDYRLVLTGGDITRPGSDVGYYAGTLDTDRLEAIALLDTQADPSADELPEVRIMGQVAWREPGAAHFTYGQWFPVRLLNTVVQGSEGAPYPPAADLQALLDAYEAGELGGGAPTAIPTGLPTQTANLPLPYFLAIYNTLADEVQGWLLVASTAATNSGAGIVRATDYAAGTNERVWFRKPIQ